MNKYHLRIVLMKMAADSVDVELFYLLRSQLSVWLIKNGYGAVPSLSLTDVKDLDLYRVSCLIFGSAEQYEQFLKNNP